MMKPTLFLAVVGTFIALTTQQNVTTQTPTTQLSTSSTNVPHTATKFGEKYDEALEAILSVALRLEALLSDTGFKHSKNFMVSPLSIALGVGELLLGARGIFREQLYDLLVIDTHNVNKSETVRHPEIKNHTHIPYYALHEQLGNLLRHLEEKGEADKLYILKTASVLFVQKALNVSETYRQDIKHFYGTEIEEMDFAEKPLESEEFINQWAQNNTRGLIKSVLPGPLPLQTTGVLANAVYFKGDWEVPFSSEINKNGTFKSSINETVNVTYMIGEFENYKYVHSKRLNCQMVVIPYENRELSMYIILPSEDNGNEFNINKFTTSLRTKDILELIDTARERKVFMVLPKMSLSNTISVLEPLKRYYHYKIQLQMSANAQNGTAGVESLEDRIDSFQNLAQKRVRSPLPLDLTGISEDPRFEISNIYQQMTLAVNEKGTEAAAVGASIMDYILDSVYFRVDRPFLFFIRHEATGASLFWGTIVDPTENMDQ